jgi:predicted kinase
MRRYYVPQQGEKRRQCGVLASIFNAVEVQKNKHAEYKLLAIEYTCQIVDKVCQLLSNSDILIWLSCAKKALG